MFRWPTMRWTRAPNRTAGRLCAALRTVFEDPAIEKVGHDLKRDVIGARALRRDAARPRVRHDARKLPARRDPVRASARGGRAPADLGYKALTEEDVRGRGAKARGLEDLPPAAVLDFAGERVDLAWQLEQCLAPALAAEQLDGVYRDLEQPLVPVLAEIEQAGIKVDCGVLGRLSERLERELAGASREDLRRWRADRSTSTLHGSSRRSCSTG